jgi:hypothetical protein
MKAVLAGGVPETAVEGLVETLAVMLARNSFNADGDDDARRDRGLC